MVDIIPLVKVFMYFFVLPLVIAKIAKWGVLRSFFVTILTSLILSLVIRVSVPAFIISVLIYFNIGSFAASIVFQVFSIFLNSIVLMAALKTVSDLFFSKDAENHIFSKKSYFTLVLFKIVTWLMILACFHF